ncbi:MAG TPA: hypothetical protein VIH40_11770 [Xanthobacteraceae bacterium]
MIRLDLTIAEIVEFAVNPMAVPDLAAVMTCRSHDGAIVSFGIGPKALATLVSALIENSPRTPGTPGRN